MWSFSVSLIFSLAVFYRVFAMTPSMKPVEKNITTNDDAYVVTEIVVRKSQHIKLNHNFWKVYRMIFFNSYGYLLTLKFFLFLDPWWHRLITGASRSEIRDLLWETPARWNCQVSILFVASLFIDKSLPTVLNTQCCLVDHLSFFSCTDQK